MGVRAKALRALLKSSQLEYLMEAHDGISAKIVETVGFPGIWASGLSIATALGVRDCNEASWTQVVRNVELMVDQTQIPILVDGDTGFGNFNNVRMLVKKLSQLDVGGVALEDKMFPKANSFLNAGHELADVGVFCGKIEAAKDSQRDGDFVVVARTEALIAGLGVSEALDRAYHYEQAGADAIIVHSKSTTANEVLSFSDKWHGDVPLIIIPTTYYKTPVERYADSPISLIIWANHNLRSSVQAMLNVSQQLYLRKNPEIVNKHIIEINDLFDLMGYSELKQAERKYENSEARKNEICTNIT